MNPNDPTFVPRAAVPPSQGAIEKTAADWLVRRHAGWGAGEEELFRAWLKSDARHGPVLTELERTWAALNQPRVLGRSEEMRRTLKARGSRRTRRRRRWTVGTAVFAVAAALVVALFPSGSVPPGLKVAPSTVAIRPHRQPLTDGSWVELNAGAEIAVEFSEGRREVKLLRGEALFEVVKDARRPFVVVAAAFEVRAVGTAFSVRHGALAIDVVVTEGRVAIERSASGAAPAQASTHRSAPGFTDVAKARSIEDHATLVAAGERAVLSLGPQAAPAVAHPLTPVEMAAAFAWRGRRIEFTATPLAEAAALFNRKNRMQLSLADAQTGHLQVTGIFWVDDPEGFVRLIEAGLDVQAHRSAARIVLERTPATGR